jgi:hypothetical protein
VSQVRESRQAAAEEKGVGRIGIRFQVSGVGRWHQVALLLMTPGPHFS